MMQKVLNNIVVDNPSRDVAQMPSQVSRGHLAPYSRAEEERRMGSFELEEGIRNVLACLDRDCTYNLDEIQEFNANIENLIRSNNI